MEEAFISAAEKDDGVTEDMAIAIRESSGKANVTSIVHASAALDISDSLFLDADYEEDDDDDDYIDEEEEDDS